MKSTPTKQLDLDAVDDLVSHWTRRLKIEVPEYGFAGNPDAAEALGMAITALIGEDDLRAARPDVYIGNAVVTGVRIALDVLADPFGDPRKQIMEHLSCLKCEIRGDAERARYEARTLGYGTDKHADAPPPPPVNGQCV